MKTVNILLFNEILLDIKRVMSKNNGVHGIQSNVKIKDYENAIKFYLQAVKYLMVSIYIRA